MSPPWALPAPRSWAALPCPLSRPYQPPTDGPPSPGPTSPQRPPPLHSPVHSPVPTSPQRPPPPPTHTALSIPQALPARKGRAPVPCPLPRPYHLPALSPPRALTACKGRAPLPSSFLSFPFLSSFPRFPIYIFFFLGGGGRVSPMLHFIFSSFVF